MSIIDLDTTMHGDVGSRGGELIDELAVQAAIEGDTSVGLTRAEHAEAFRRLCAERDDDDNPLSDGYIAEILGTTRRNVQRWKAGEVAPQARPSKRQPIKAVPPVDEHSSKAPLQAPPESVEALLATSVKSASPAIVEAAHAVREAVLHLRSVIRTESEAAQAAADVERLQRELAEAQARLDAVKPTKRKRKTRNMGISYRAVWDWAVETGQVERKSMGVPPKALIEAYKAAQS